MSDDEHIMRKPAVFLALVAVFGLGWTVYVASQPGGNNGGPLVFQTTPTASASAVSASNVTVSPDVAQSGTTLPVVPGSSGSASLGPADYANAMRLQINALGLTRELAGVQVVNYDNRSRTVLGTKETTNAQSTQTVLVIRDDTSGQIDYWQSALQFVLKPGNSYEAYIKERPAMQRRFVNIEQAQVAVDAANIAKEHAALKTDARVASVNFMPVEVRPTAK